MSTIIPLLFIGFRYLRPLSFCLSMFHFLLFHVLELSSVSSLERSSPLPEGRSRSLRSSRPFGSSSVTVVKMTPLSFLPGTRIIKYLGIINMFFIRETTSLREVRPQGLAPTFRHQVYRVHASLHVILFVFSRKAGSVAFSIPS